jgi:hypothetical protein
MADNADPSSPVTPLPSWLNSGIIKSLILALATLIVAIASLFIKVDDVFFMSQAEKIGTAIATFVSVAGPIIYAIWARMHKPTPPITAQAVQATVTRELKIENAITTADKKEASK